jgi:hypothetical protein
LAIGGASAQNSPVSDGTIVVFSLLNNMANVGDSAQICFHLKANIMKLYYRSKYNGQWRDWTDSV